MPARAPVASCQSATGRAASDPYRRPDRHCPTGYAHIIDHPYFNIGDRARLPWRFLLGPRARSLRDYNATDPSPALTTRFPTDIHPKLGEDPLCPPDALRQNLGSHLAHEADDGTCLLYIDRHLGHEVTSPQAFEAFYA